MRKLSDWQLVPERLMGLVNLATRRRRADEPGPSFFGGADHVVFVQTDNTAGNQIVAYDRSDNGSSLPAGTYDTGGLGGQLTGSVVDHLARKDHSPTTRGSTLYAMNAGSNTVSVFWSEGTASPSARWSTRVAVPSERPPRPGIWSTSSTPRTVDRSKAT